MGMGGAAGTQGSIRKRPPACAGHSPQVPSHSGSEEAEERMEPCRAWKPPAPVPIPRARRPLP